MPGPAAVPCRLTVFPLRLTPGTEIVSALTEFVRANALQAAFVLTCVGSVRSARLRYATHNNTERVETLDRCFEICSLVGTVRSDGAHLHVTLGDASGATVAGHVMPGGLWVQTTAEIVLGEAAGARFTTSYDAETGWPELVIQPTDGSLTNTT